MCYYLRKILNNRKLFSGMNMNGEYDTQKGYEWIMGSPTEFKAHHIVWNKLTSPKHQFFQWLIWRNRLNTRVRLSRFMEIDTNCVLCNAGKEDREHLVYVCSYMKNIKAAIGQWIHYRWLAENDDDMMEEIKQIKGRKRRQIVMAAFAAICYAVWRARNMRIKQQKMVSSKESKEWIKFHMKTFINHKLKGICLQ
ncbi:unnamed protein product [Cuscuta campestris]|uniref:Reverse transcriptase zinc-binding domain-containing protein n=1 Tax=Cuscuta campestris TaxID=132261 RepID=A0A484LQM8_9ASTE|nr:unnamed protein product [Cuscuta campestris]